MQLLAHPPKRHRRLLMRFHRLIRRKALLTPFHKPKMIRRKTHPQQRAK